MNPPPAITAEYHPEGHSRGWTIGVPGYGPDRHIPASLAHALARTVGGEFTVDNRGSHLEVASARCRAGESCRQRVTDALATFARTTPALVGLPVVVEVCRPSG